MRVHAAWAIARNEALLLVRDPWLRIYLLVTPIVFGALTIRTATVALDAPGVGGADGPEHIVAGLAVTFSFMLVGDIGSMFLRDHLNNMWDDLRATPASRLEILSGKVALSLTCAVVYFVGTFYVAAAVFGVRVEATPLVVVLLAAGLAVVLVMLGALIFTLSSTAAQMVAMVNVSTAVCAGLGGTVIPRELLPAPVARLAPLTPGYWAMSGLETATRGTDVVALLRSLGVFLVFSVVFGGAALVGLAREGRKVI